MKKTAAFLVSGLVIVAFAVYFFFSNQSTTPVIVSNNPSPSTSGSEPAQNPSTTSPSTPLGSNGGSPNPSPTPAPTPKSAGQYKDGTYTGPVVDAVYGQVQVVATIQNGKLTDTNCPVYPTDGGHTMEVSRVALPQLRQEAITSQSANVDIVSGATQTSQAYMQSLAAALAMAKS